MLSKIKYYFNVFVYIVALFTLGLMIWIGGKFYHKNEKDDYDET